MGADERLAVSARMRSYWRTVDQKNPDGRPSDAVVPPNRFVPTRKSRDWPQTRVSSDHRSWEEVPETPAIVPSDCLK